MKAIGDVSSIAARRTRSGFCKSDELQLKAIEQVLEEGIERMKLGEVCTPHAVGIAVDCP